MESRVTRLEDDMRDIKATLMRLEPMIVRIDATMPFLARKSDLADLRTELKGDMAGLRSELKSEIADLRTELKGEIADLRTEQRTDSVKLRAEIAAVWSDSRNDLLEFRAEVAAEFGRVHVELARKASLAGVWTVGITLLALTVGDMAAGAIYLPLLFRVLHLAAP